MNNIYLLFFTVFASIVYGQDTTTTLSSEMQRLETETVLIVQSQAIDEFPLWSPNSDFIACNIQGDWFKFRLSNIELTNAKWRDQTISVVTTKNSHTKLTKNELKSFKKVSEFNAREITTKNGTTIKLKMEGISVSLIVTKKDAEEKVYWTSGGENCHSLVLSPDEKYVAYLCELNGLLVMKIE